MVFGEFNFVKSRCDLAKGKGVNKKTNTFILINSRPAIGLGGDKSDSLEIPLL